MSSFCLFAAAQLHLWETDIQWNGADGDHEVNDDYNDWPILSIMSVITRRALNKLTDYSAIGRRNCVETWKRTTTASISCGRN